VRNATAKWRVWMTFSQAAFNEGKQMPANRNKRTAPNKANEPLRNLPLTQSELELVFAVFNSDCENGSGENDPAFYRVRDKAKALLRS
jgi:hypothetical protein